MKRNIFPSIDDLGTFDDRKDMFANGSMDIVPGVMNNQKDILKCIKDAYPDDPSCLRGHSYAIFAIYNVPGDLTQYAVICGLIEDGGDFGLSKFNASRDAFIKFVHEYCPQYDMAFDPANIKNITTGIFDEDQAMKLMVSIDMARANFGLTPLTYPYRKIN